MIILPTVVLTCKGATPLIFLGCATPKVDSFNTDLSMTLSPVEDGISRNPFLKEKEKIN